MDSSLQPDLTVLVPALNEQDTIQEVIDRLLAIPLSTQIIVINDGSSDSTPKILASFGSKIEVITNPQKSGKGAAIRKALPLIRGRFVVVQDADLEYFPEEIPVLVAPLLAGSAKVSFGTRFSSGFPAGMALPNKIVNVLLALSARVLYGQKITDEATCYKAIERQTLLDMNLECKGFEFCPEVTAKASRLGEKILEVPIRYVPRSKAAGKKIRWTDAPIAFWTLAKYRFWRKKS